MLVSSAVAGLNHLLADRENGIQGCSRFLKDHADLAAADLPDVFPRQAEQVAPLEHDLAGDDAAGRQEAAISPLALISTDSKSSDSRSDQQKSCR